MKRKSPKETALMIRPASLPDKTRALIAVQTPQEFIKQRPGRGNKTFTYVEGGYVIAKLNQIFSPVGWDFEITKERVEQTEVVVRGKLTIKDHKNGYTISKTQYGTKERNAGVPLGDTLKAAATDCLKKCASLFGIALDVYWQQLDEDKLTSAPLDAKKGIIVGSPKVGGVKKQPIASTITNSQMIKMSFDKIRNEFDPTILQQYKKRIMEVSVYTDAQKKTLCEAIDRKIRTKCR
jgi:hypothetical protein